MGWTCYKATHYKRGTVDRKAEMDERWTQHEHDGYPELKVLKSCMRGAVYYAAVEVNRNNIREKVFGAIAITSVNSKDCCNFGYKDMDETMGPFYYDCPMSILNLLTPTDNQSANDWRQKCEEKHLRKKNGQSLSSLPVGTTIKFELCGEMITATKMNPAYQFKRPWWYRKDKHSYVSKTRIPDNFCII